MPTEIIDGTISATAAPGRFISRAAPPATQSNRAATGLAPPQRRLNSTAIEIAAHRGTRVVVNSVSAIRPQANPQAKVMRPSTTFAIWVTAAARPPRIGRAGRSRCSSRVVYQVPTTAAIAPVSFVPRIAIAAAAHSVYP